MEFVMIVELDEVGRKRLEAAFQTEKPSFSYRITERPEEALDILEHQKTDVLVCETSLSVLSGREFFTMAKMISPDTVRVAMTSAEHVKDILSFLNECDIYKLIMKPCASFSEIYIPSLKMLSVAILSAVRIMLRDIACFCILSESINWSI